MVPCGTKDIIASLEKVETTKGFRKIVNAQVNVVVEIEEKDFKDKT